MATLSVTERPVTPGELPMITDRAMYESVEGQRVEMPPMSAYSGIVATRLATRITIHVEDRRLGTATTETLFRLPTRRQSDRRPDVAFVSADRWPLDQPIPIVGNAWDVVPDLAVEVISPSDLVFNLHRKIDEYFEAGVRHVWLVHPESQKVEVYRSRSDIEVFQSADELVDEEVLPGFRLKCDAIFPPCIPAPPAPESE